MSEAIQTKDEAGAPAERRVRMVFRQVRIAPIKRRTPPVPPAATEAVALSEPAPGRVAEATPLAEAPRVPAGRLIQQEGETRAVTTRKGRGAVSNPSVRFEPRHAEPADDGWGSLEEMLSDLPPLETQLIRDTTRTVIARNTSPDVGFDRSINPYRGCEHGCVYCFARPSHAYLGYSPGLDFETKLVFKPEVGALLDRELRRANYVCKPITLGSNTDPYQPVERRLRLTRAALEVLLRFRHPISIVTKSAGVLQDLDLLKDFAAQGLVRVFVSITTLDGELARRMEPRASAPTLRLRAISGLAEAGVPVGVLSAPMIPGLNDAELEAILAAAAKAGAKRAGLTLLRLPHELKGIFEAWLQEHVPDRAAHVLSLVRQMRGGALNDARFGHRFAGSGPYAELIHRRFERAVRQHGLDTGWGELRTDLFRVPEAVKTPERQMSLF